MGEENKDTKNLKPEGDGKVTEDDLLKSLSDLEGKKPDEKKPEGDKKVEAALLEKSTAETIKDGASEALKKALDVSAALSEITSLIGAHVDDSLETLQKSIQASADRDQKFIAILENFQKSITELGEKIAEFGGTPAKKPSAKNDAGKTEVLQKSVEGGEGEGGEGAGAGKSDFTRVQVLGTMERLSKSAKMGSVEQNRWQSAAIKFESTGQINNKDLLEIRTELKAA